MVKTEFLQNIYSTISRLDCILKQGCKSSLSCINDVMLIKHTLLEFYVESSYSKVAEGL